MRALPSNTGRLFSRARNLLEIDAASDHEPIAAMGVLARLAMLLVIALGFSVAAQLLVNSPF